ncbi:hypothetical protein CO683_03815 [Bradyrhizobium ottawaense]|uniref:hypothetical protein n=1 Tax=Bradyrhizobium ottawaense TaxID=931866 RepID=UPI000BE8F343|nr:hypothetical protein [Bradyrhizobium ottawaense]PDT72261.1 hypothetical protein CO683_03815 [Bradyrhizobium ottawaense]
MTRVGPKLRSEKRVLLAMRGARNILARHVEPGGLDERATIDALLTVLDDEEVVEAVRELERTLR